MKKLLLIPFLAMLSSIAFAQMQVKPITKMAVGPVDNRNSVKPARLASLKKIYLPALSLNNPVIQRITPISGGTATNTGGISIAKTLLPSKLTKGAKTSNRDGARYCTYEAVNEQGGDYTKIVLGNQYDKIFPGVIYYDNAVIDGSYNAPANMQLNPYDINISLFSAASSASTIVNVEPSMGTVNNGIAELMRRQSNVINAGMVSVEADYMYSASQLSYFLQSGFQGFGVDMNTEFGASATTKKNVIFIKLHQVYFSVALNRPDGGLLVKTRTGLPSNLVYVNKVNYGRIGILRVESDFTKEQVKTAIDFSLNALGTTTSASARATNERVLSSSNIEGFFFGGDAANTVSVFSATDLSQFNGYVKNGLRLNPNVAPVPVSYELKYLSDNASAAINAVTSYTQKTCTTAQTMNITLNGISIEDIHGGDCSYAWGSVELEVWELVNGVRSRMVQPIVNGVPQSYTSGENAIWYYPNKARPQRSIINYASIRDNQQVNLNNVNKTWRYDLDPDKVTAGDIMIVVKSNINTNHKDNDFAALGFHGMNRVETASFPLRDVIVKQSDIPTKAKYGSMIAGPYSSNSNRLHSFRAHFTVTPGN